MKLKRLIFIALWFGLLCLTACQPKVAVLPVIDMQNAADLEVIGKVSYQDPLSVVWALDGESFWVMGYNELARYNSQTLEKEFTFKVDEPGLLLDASPDGISIAYTPEKDGSFSVLNTMSNTAIEIDCGEPYGNVKFSPEGKEITSTSMNEWKVSVWDSTTGKLKRTLEGFETAAPVYSAQIGEDGKTLVWLARGTAQLQEMESGTMGSEFGHEDFISAYTLAPGGEVFATAAYAEVDEDYSPVLYLWDVRSGDLLNSFTYKETIQSLSFSPDGQLLAVASGKLVNLLETESQQEYNLVSQAANVSCVKFSPDGQSLLTCGEDDQVRLWRVISPS
jgi:WD40 repeat protein